MNAAMKWGVILAAIEFVINLVSMGAGLHTNQAAGMVTIVIYIGANVACVVMALKATAAVKGYGGQLGSGVLLGVVAAVLIVVLSYLLLTVVFPDATDEMLAMQAAQVESSGAPQEQIDMQLKVMETMSTPAIQAAMGGFFTVLTSVIASAIAAIWLRKKPTASPAPAV